MEIGLSLVGGGKKEDDETKDGGKKGFIEDIGMMYIHYPHMTGEYMIIEYEDNTLR